MSILVGGVGYFGLFVGFEDPSYPIRQKTEVYILHTFFELIIPSVIPLNSSSEYLKLDGSKRNRSNPLQPVFSGSSSEDTVVL